MADDAERLAADFLKSAMLDALDKLGIAERLADRPADASELARATGCHRPSLVRLLRALTALGVVSQGPPGSYRLADAGERLVNASPDPLVPAPQALASTHVEAAWLELAHAVRTGRSAFQYAHGIDYRTYLARHPELAASRLGRSASLPCEQTDALVSAYDFSSIETIVDVGGGSGLLLASILARNPDLQGIVFDRRSRCASTTALLRDRGLAERALVVAGDPLAQPPPSADAYLLVRMLGERSHADSLRLLQNCRRSAQRASRLVVVEPFDHPPDAMAELETLVLHGEARGRTEDEVRRLIAAAGFSAVRIVPGGSGASILEGVPA